MIGLSLYTHLQVAGLALWKLFDNFSVDELVHSMAGVIAASHTKEEDWDEQQTPVSTSHLSVTVKMRVVHTIAMGGGGGGGGGHTSLTELINVVVVKYLILRIIIHDTSMILGGGAPTLNHDCFLHTTSLLHSILLYVLCASAVHTTVYVRQITVILFALIPSLSLLGRRLLKAPVSVTTRPRPLL